LFIIDDFLGTTSVISRIHFELLLVNGIEFHLKCLSKNGIFINNNYTKMSSTIVLPKQYDYYFYNYILFFFSTRCTLRFPSTDLCISFSSLLNNNNNNNNSIHRTSSENISRHISIDTSQRRLSSSTSTDTTFQSVPNQQQQQVILVAVNQQNQSDNNFQPLSINIPNSLSSSLSSPSFSAGSSNGQIKSQHECPTPTTTHSFLG
jgi:hypothetical protein